MSVFPLPIWVIDKIDKIRRSFLWKGPLGTDKKLNLVSWDSVCKPKRVGGLGVLELRTFNLSLLAKWIWRFFTFPTSPLPTLLSHLQITNPSLPPAIPALSKSFSHIWPAFLAGFSFSINSGQQALFWLHDWGLGILQYRFPELLSFATHTSISVAHFLLQWSSPQNLFLPSMFSTSLPSTQLNQLFQLLSENASLIALPIPQSAILLLGNSSPITSHPPPSTISLNPLPYTFHRSDLFGNSEFLPELRLLVGNCCSTDSPQLTT
ncbi:hypothetical protein LUZ61_001225 [Rhynchospora tenuis]|uniref:Reverse transcriptase zinc-binding domain-containing protein n=1 Tax=Rhynchospora tenuis TaxID=198213 RepID=A0AAD5ZGL7_9POAL|nr:hypothetical protein LUZ61_001225 [Rhynchospora tenuis]